MTTFYVLQWLEHYGPNTPPEMTGPRLGVREQRYGNDALTNSGNGWQMWPDDPTILETLEFEDWEEAELHYYRNYRRPTPSDLAVSAGWLSPTGVFYTCGHEEHDELALQITAALWGNLDGVGLLEKHNWVRIESCGAVRVGSRRGKPTEAQRAVLGRLAELDGDAQWKELLSFAAEED